MKNVMKKMNVMKMNTEEAMGLLTIVNHYKPKFSVTKVVVLDDDTVLAINGSDSYKINFIEDLELVINQTKGNLGWGVCPNNDGKTHLQLVSEALYQKDYVGSLEASL